VLVSARYYLPAPGVPGYTKAILKQGKESGMSQESLKEVVESPGSTVAQPPSTTPISQKKHTIRNWLLPSLESCLFFAIFLGVVLFGQVRILGVDGDIGWHLRQGNEMLTHGGPVITNTLTIAGYGQPVLAWEWLSEIIFVGAWRLFGLNGVVAVTAFIIALTAFLLFRAVQRRGTPILLAFPLTLAALALTSIHWLTRPHIFSLLLTLWWSEQLWAYWQSGNARKLWPLPFVMVLWANLHGGFIAGLIILGAATALVWVFPNAASTRNVRARRWQLTRILLACMLATLLTPWGVAEPLYVVDLLSNKTILSNAQEMQSPDFHQAYGQIFLVLLILLGACGILRGWLAGGRAAHPADLEAQGEQRLLARLAVREPGALGWLLVGIFTAMTFLAVRSLPLWAVVVTPILGRELTCWMAEWGAADTKTRLARGCRFLFHRSWQLDALNKHLRSGIVMGLAGIIVLLLLLNKGTLPGTAAPILNAHFSPSAFPVEAVQTIQQGKMQGGALPAGAGFTTMEWAGYVEFTLPQHPVMVDTREDFFDPSVLQDYQTIANGAPGWDQLLSEYGIHWLLIPQTIPLAQSITLTQSWTCQELDARHLALYCIPAPGIPVA
jgi:hypothetical protein